MRILLYLKSLQNYQLNFEYHYKIQGFVYSLLRNTSFSHLHDKYGFKFFSFSNIYKSKNSEYHNLIISSPDQTFIDEIKLQLNKIITNHIPLELGGLFELKKIIKIPEKNLEFPLKVITQSPIIVRIHLEKYVGTVTDTAPHKEIFWKSNHPVDLFVDAIEKNLRKKILEFSRRTFEERIIETFDFKKQVSTKINMPYSRITVIGSLWEMKFSTKIPKDIQIFVLDSGFGERNSLGFGFVNPIIKKQYR